MLRCPRRLLRCWWLIVRWSGRNRKTHFELTLEPSLLYSLCSVSEALETGRNVQRYHMWTSCFVRQEQSLLVTLILSPITSFSPRNPATESVKNRANNKICNVYMGFRKYPIPTSVLGGGHLRTPITTKTWCPRFGILDHAHLVTSRRDGELNNSSFFFKWGESWLFW